MYSFLTSLDTAIPTSLLIFSTIVNIALVSLALKKISTDEKSRKNKEPDKSDQSNNTDDIVHFLESQAVETSELLKNDPLIDKRVIALRTAYLRIERSSIDKGISTDKYWQHLGARLEKLLRIFMPKLFTSEDQINTLKNKIKLLKDRVAKLSEKQNLDENKEIIEPHKTLDSFLNSCVKNINRHNSIDNHLKNMESAIAAYENPQFQQYLAKVYELKGLHKKSSESSSKVQELLAQQCGDLESMKVEIGKISEVDNENTVDGSHFRHQPEIYAEISEGAEKLRKENDLLKRHIEELKNSQNEYNIKLNDHQKKITSIAMDSNILSKDTYDELDKISEEMARVNRKEIDRLRSVVSEQRSSIRAMEAGLTQLESDVTQSNTFANTKRQEIESLRQNVKDANSCITMLENEIDTLRNRIGDKPAEHRSSTLPGDDIVELSAALEKVNSELESELQVNSINEKLLTFFEEAMQASSLEDMAFLLFEEFSEYNASPSLLIKNGKKKLDIAAGGKVSKQDRILIENMRIGEINLNSNDGGIRFRFSSIGGVLRPDKNGPDLKQKSKDLVRMARISDKVIEKIGGFQAHKAHKKEIEICANEVKKIAYDVDKSYVQQFSRSKTLIDTSVSQVQDIGRSMGLDSKQLDGIQSIKEDAIKEIDADDVVRLMIRKKFLGIIRQLDDAL